MSTTTESVAKLRESTTNEDRLVRRKVELNDEITGDDELHFDEECNDDEDSHKEFISNGEILWWGLHKETSGI